MTRKARRIHRDFTPEDHERWEQAVEQAERDRTHLLEQADRLEQAAAEPTLSGRLRRAVHSSELTLPDIAARLGLTPVELVEFLTGDRELPSSTIDRLASLLGYELVQTCEIRKGV